MYVGGRGKDGPPEKVARPALMGWLRCSLADGAILQGRDFPQKAMLVGEVALFFLLPVKGGDL